MRLNEQRKEALIKNADKLHSGGSMVSPSFKPKRSSWPLTIAVLCVLVAVGYVFNA
tara:strand:- start:1660 stop:1827 length:168 start_codon:yes stop_codon:yes gene_type:complete